MLIDAKIRKQIDFLKAATCPETHLLRRWLYDEKRFVMPYPEVTGYAIPTIIKAGKLLFDKPSLDLAKGMLDGLL